VDVDVIVPVYNGERFVRRAVNSALRQALEGGRVTIWCIDDGSVDGSWELLQQLAANPCVRILKQQNRGTAAARNTAIRQGSAELIAFLDQDDEWLDGSLAARVAVLRGRPEVGYVTGLQDMVTEDGSLPSWARGEWLANPVQPGPLPSALVVRRACFERVGYLEESLSAGGDDADWFARARRHQVPHVMLDSVVVRRSIRNDNQSADPATGGDLLAMVRRHLNAQGEDRR
jgi:glycosyltransferase involved in cell wall biosynthesis